MNEWRKIGKKGTKEEAKWNLKNKNLNIFTNLVIKIGSSSKSKKEDKNQLNKIIVEKQKIIKI